MPFHALPCPSTRPPVAFHALPRPSADLPWPSTPFQVRLWDVSRASPELKRLVGHTAPVSCVAWSPDDDLIASGGDEGKVVLYGRQSFGGRAPCKVGIENDIVLMRQERMDDGVWRTG